MPLPANMAASYRLNHKPIVSRNLIVRRDKPLKNMTALASSIDAISEEEELPLSPVDQAGPSDETFVFSSDDEHEGNKDTSSRKVVSTALAVYEAICKKNKVLPIACVKEGLVEEVLECKSIPLTKAELHSICVALAASYMVETAIFEHNGIGDIGVPILGEIVRDSPYLTQICIRANDLKSKGAKIICDSVKQNYNINLLDLSANGFVESDGHFFKSLIEECKSLRELNLSNNCLSEEGVKLIAQGLRKNKSLHVLDLNWNHIRRDGASAVGDALVCNTGLQNLNLAWNGLHMEGAKATAKALKKNTTLTGLDLTCNRMTDMCMMELMKGLEKNTKLQILRIGNNHITSDGALAILQHLKSHKASGIKLLDLGRLEVHDTFEKLQEELKKERGLKVIYGLVWSTKVGSIGSYDQCDDESALLQCDPITVLMECMRLQNVRFTDFIKDTDITTSSDKRNFSKDICINELCEGMQKLNVPLNRVTLMKILSNITKDGGKVLDFEEMLGVQREHMQKIKASNPQDIGYRETEIGKVSMHLKRIMGKQFTVKHRVQSDTPSSRSNPRTSRSTHRQSKKQPENRKTMWDSYGYVNKATI